MTISKFVNDKSGIFRKDDGDGRGVYRMNLGGVVAPVRGMTRKGYVEGLAYLCGLRIVALGGNRVKIVYR